MSKKIIISLIFCSCVLSAPWLTAQESGKVDEQSSRSVLNQEVQSKVIGLDKKAKEEVLLREFEIKQQSLYNKNSKTVTDEKQSQLNDIIDVMSLEIPNSFSYNYAVYLNNNREAESFDNLIMANEQSPQDVRVQTEMVAAGELYNDPGLKTQYCGILNNSGVYNSAEIEYNSNVLKSVDKNGYILTNGNVDTYPVWINQEVNNQNKSAQILNLDLLQNENYRNRICDQIGIPRLSGNQSSEQIIRHFLSYKKNGEMHLALTLPHHIIVEHSTFLYLSGLALVYDQNPSVNYNEKLDQLWRSEFGKNHLESNDPLNRNYLIFLKRLHEYYKAKGENSEAREVKKYIEKISENFGLKNPIKK